MQAIIFCGIQASGKSTFYRERFFHSHVRLSLDLLRTRHRERQFLLTCLQTQARFVVDNTNPTVAERQRYLEAAKAAGYEVIGYFFALDPYTAIQRDQRRPPAQQVPPKGILGTYKRLQIPTLAEGFTQLYHVDTNVDGTFQLTEMTHEF
jgi:predicted kinase